MAPLVLPKSVRGEKKEMSQKRQEQTGVYTLKFDLNPL